MNRKAVFFDADGTVTDMRKGVPESAREAIRSCRANGNLVFLCTGRSRALVDQPLVDIGFDGIIAAAGAYLEKEGKILYNKEVTPSQAEDSLQNLRKYGLVPVMEGKDYMYYDLEEYTDEVEWTASVITRLLGKKFCPIEGNEGQMHINKISAKAVKGSHPEAAISALSPYFDAVVHDGGSFAGTIEFLPKGYSKALGIAVVCRLWGIEREDTIAFGDSNNDLEMFEYVHTKVAMGNGSEKLIARADYVTADMFHYGIRDGLKMLGLI